MSAHHSHATPAKPLVFHASRPTPSQSWLARVGRGMQRHASLIRTLQWGVVLFYWTLVTLPAFLPLPPEGSTILNNLTLFAQFLFWGIWWPFVMVSMMLMGRVWCGVFCPEGSLTEWVSHRGLGKPVPRWMKWSGWPFFAFICTTVYGQLVSVYEYPKAALLVLGGSTVAAIGVGLLYGKGKRVWCRHLCPASGVFALLSKLSPLHFRVDRQAWNDFSATAEHPAKPVNCAPLVDIRRMTSASECHACGRCAGHRDAIELSARVPGSEILRQNAQQVSRAEALTLLYGVLGLATAAFQWTMSPWFVAMKTAAANWLIDREMFTLLEDDVPWWVLTHYPEVGDVFTWLDGLCILAYILGGGLLIGSLLGLGIALSSALSGADKTQLNWRKLTLSLVPIGGFSVFLGLSMLTITLLKGDGYIMPWVPTVRAILLALGLAGSAWLGLRLLWTAGRSIGHKLIASLAFALPIALMGWIWHQVFWVW